MKNLSISLKLILGFGIVLILLIVAGLMSIVNINSINGQITLYSKYTVPNAESVRVMQTSMRGILGEIPEAILTAQHGDMTSAKAALDTAAGYGSMVVATLDAYKENQRNDSRDAAIEELKGYITEAAAIRVQISELVLAGTANSLAQAEERFLNEYKPALDQCLTVLEDFSTTAKERAVTQEEEAAGVVNQALLIVIAISAVSLIITIAVVIIIRGSIMKPVNEIVRVFKEVAKGNMKAKINYDAHDELGQMAKLIKDSNAMQGSILGDIIEKFGLMAKGDLRINVDIGYPGDFAALKESMEDMVSNLNHTMQTIDTAAEQVSTGSAQVASGAQALAAGSTEQASSVEQLTVSIGRIAEQAEENTSNVQEATRFVEQAADGVQTSNEHMGQLTEAMSEISTSSNQITNITKAIEDIAFQTNILALNAAIEAARAGNAGKGFAVVADEVRNLAAKSAEAAKQTAELIQSSVATVAKGSQLTTQTAQILQDVGQKAKKVVESIEKIESASSEQAVAIDQIKQGLNQVSSVIQTNAATAEENSATSEEMSAQAATLREEVGRFRLKNDYESENLERVPLLKGLAKSKGEGPALLEASVSLGKY